MVSIPDWSKLGRLFDAPRENTPNPNRLRKQREAKIVKQAEESGYFLNVSRSYIENNVLEEEEDPNEFKSVLDKYNVQEKDLGKIQMMKFVSAHLRSVGDIGLCNNLSICVLSGNFITRFDALISCTRLMKLDLHNNQISSLPGQGFWVCMHQLQLLHLHDNPIGHLENLHCIAACPSLIGLTLYDTPLSLKKNYRHHVVNSIWTLKALDSYVISDEEIIEDAELGGHFAALHQNFSIELCPTIAEECDFDKERAVTLGIVSEINLILKHNSPVMIIQRFTRGWLTRKTLELLHGSSSGYQAAKKIQKKYFPYQKKSSSAQLAGAHKNDLDLDYDTYLENRRPGSKTVSEVSIPVTKQNDMLIEEFSDKPVLNEMPAQRSLLPELPPDRSGHFERLPPTPEPDGTTRHKHFYVNLAKLQTGTLQSLQEDASKMETMLPSDDDRELLTFRETKSRKESRRSKPKVKDEKQIKLMNSVKHYFGPVVETVISPEPPAPDNSFYDSTDDELPQINFRLKGLKQKVTYFDPISDMVLSKQQAGKELRAAEDEYHRNRQLDPKPSVEKKQNFNNNKRLFHRVQGTMGLSCLWAVQKAYKDREKAEKRTAKLEQTMSLKEQREAAKERIKIFQEEKKNKALKQRERDNKKNVEILEKRELARLNYMEKSNHSRIKSSQFARNRRAEWTFVSDFNAQNTSVSNALIRHDRQTRSEDKMQEQTENTRALREREKEQHEVVDKYLEHRQLMRQTETAMQRAALDTKMLQEANDRIMEAKGRVEQQKQRSATVEQFYPLPSVSTHSLPPMDSRNSRRLVVSDLRGLDRFHTDVYIKQGRIGRHPTSVV